MRTANPAIDRHRKTDHQAGELRPASERALALALASGNVVAQRIWSIKICISVRDIIHPHDKFPMNTDEQNTLVRDALGNGLTRAWAERYFDLIARVYELMISDKEDPRIVTTVRKSTGDIFVTINNRWVLQPMVGAIDADFIEGAGIIVSHEFATALPPSRISSWQFKPRAKESNAPWLVRFENFTALESPEVMAEWRNAMVRELKFGSRSANRKFHNPTIVDLARDRSKRKEWFDSIAWA